MNYTRKIALNTLIQVGGRVFGLLIMLVTINFIANYLIVDGSALTGYGQYHIVFTFVSLIAVAADLGLYTLLVRELSGKSKKEASQLIANALGFRIALLIATLAVFVLLYSILPYPVAVKIAILIGIFCAFSNLFSQVLAALFQANLVPLKIVISETLGRLVIAALTIYFLLSGFGLIPVVLATLVGNLVVLFTSTIFARRYSEIKVSFELGFWRLTSPELGGIALITLLFMIHTKADSLILSIFQPASEVGIYGLGYKLLEIIAIIPTIYVANIMPYLSGLYRAQNSEAIAPFLMKSLTIITAVAIPIAIFVYIFAPQLVVFISSPEFIASAMPLRILTLAILFAFVAEVVTGTVIAARAQRALIKPYLYVVGANIVLNIIFIPIYSYVAAAVITVITMAMLMLSVLVIARARLGKNLDMAMLGKVLALIATTFVVFSLLQPYTLISIEQFVTLGKLAQGTNLLFNALILFGGYLILLYLVFGKTKLWQNFKRTT